MMVSVKNPTTKAKAVRIAGGHQVIAPDKSEKVDVVFDDVEKARYEKAGLVFGDPKAESDGKTKKRTGLEAQATKLEIEFTDDTSDDDLIVDIKAKKDAAK